ncbi:hypothetical protein, partial [Thiolapillus sp.]|uniref:hypothetical protein n=1 Tax=Thiolapillus sp. TaxID=2017437 RepID=UPI003AF7FAAB
MKNLNRSPVNHATHEHLSLTKHILSIPFLLEYSLLKKLTKKWRSVVHSFEKKEEKKEEEKRKINRLKCFFKVKQA